MLENKGNKDDQTCDCFHINNNQVGWVSSVWRSDALRKVIHTSTKPGVPWRQVRLPQQETLGTTNEAEQAGAGFNVEDSVFPHKG